MRIPSSAEIRANLERAAREGGWTHRELSLVINRSEGYLGRFIRDGVPSLLADMDARALASFTGTDPHLFGVIAIDPVRRHQRPMSRRLR